MIDLKAWRTGHGMTQQQAADALGIGNSTVRAIEGGTREMTATLALACHGWDAMHGNPVRALTHDERAAEALERRAAPGLPADPDAIWERCEPAPGVTETYEPAPTKADLEDLRRRIVSLERLERPVRILQQRIAELSAAIEEAGVPLQQEPIPMTEEEKEEAYLRDRKAQLLEQMNRAAKPAPGALTDEERAEAEKARRAIAKARSLAQGEPWE